MKKGISITVLALAIALLTIDTSANTTTPTGTSLTTPDKSYSSIWATTENDATDTVSCTGGYTVTWKSNSLTLETKTGLSGTPTAQWTDATEITGLTSGLTTDATDTTSDTTNTLANSSTTVSRTGWKTPTAQTWEG
ncbi:MAG TPA: hypothetical protein VGO50_04785 [Pyrinomonadaceae bacterium]|jgi:hypothetical protein|nr:hypothetical protein [Pyrinomonadaceae bacterium]